jgi:hypothetical protein
MHGNGIKNAMLHNKKGREASLFVMAKPKR